MKQTRRTLPRERGIAVEVELAGEHLTQRTHRDRLEELARLAETAAVDIVGTVSQKRNQPRPATYVGQGKLQELAAEVERLGAHVILFDNDLSPAQVRNVEKATDTKAVDRSELILDIFAGRARTYEARLQVELAQLEYTYPRLRRMWTHLSRMEGGIGTRGPGETQLETDRRLVRRRITDLKRKIGAIDERKEREVRSRAGGLTVGLVGYTNAGKSSLMNALTGAGVKVEDQLFATLDTRTRKWPMPFGLEAMLSDTVGFIRNLPHHLVASFKATLEEAIHADLLLHVVDASTEHAPADLAAVNEVLEEIGCGDRAQLIVCNKADLVDERTGLDLVLQKHPDAVTTSATTGEGLDRLAEEVTTRLVGPVLERTLRVPAADGRLLAWIEQHAEVLERGVEDGAVVTRVRMPRRLIEREMPRVAERDYAVT